MLIIYMQAKSFSEVLKNPTDGKIREYFSSCNGVCQASNLISALRSLRRPHHDKMEDHLSWVERWEEDRSDHRGDSFTAKDRQQPEDSAVSHDDHTTNLPYLHVIRSLLHSVGPEEARRLANSQTEGCRNKNPVLFLAIEKQALGAFLLLVESGADLSALRNRHNQNALHWAVMSSSATITECISREHPDLNFEEDVQHWRPIHWCRKSDVLKALVSCRGGDHDDENDESGQSNGQSVDKERSEEEKRKWRKRVLDLRGGVKRSTRPAAGEEKGTLVLQQVNIC
eukprot:jgi/Bigna1/138910/aug1.47_g13618